MNVTEVQLRTGIVVPYLEQGERAGLPLILLHGWGESAAAFDRFLGALPHKFHAFAFDQRGHGGATKPEDGYTLQDAAADVVAFLDAVGVRSGILIGSSSGGYIAQQVAVSWPERVAALILIGTPLTLFGPAPFADQMESLTDPIDPDWVRQSLNWFPLSVPVPEWYVDDRVRDGLRMPARVWTSTLAGLTAARPPLESGQIRCPALIIRGGADAVIPPILRRSPQPYRARALSYTRTVGISCSGSIRSVWHPMWQRFSMACDRGRGAAVWVHTISTRTT